jgi:hypothetical protein
MGVLGAALGVAARWLGGGWVAAAAAAAGVRGAAGRAGVVPRPADSTAPARTCILGVAAIFMDEQRLGLLEARVATLQTEVAALRQWRADVEERRRQAKAQAAAAAAATATAGASATASAGSVLAPAHAAAVGPRRPYDAAAAVAAVLWSRVRGTLVRGVANFVVFLYVSKLHRWLVSVAYHYYLLLLLRLS